MFYQFDTEVAKVVGANAAVIFHNIAFWCARNRANGKHEHDGRFWTYNSASAFSELFPWLTERQIRTALGKLESAGLVVSGNYNSMPYDRTKWYAVGDEGERFALFGADKTGESTNENEEFELTKKSDQNPLNGRPVPDSKPDKKKNSKEKADAVSVIEYLNAKAGTRYRLSGSSLNPINARLSEGFTVDDCKRVIDVKCAEWLGTEWQKFLRPSTLFRPSKFEEYLNGGAAPKEQGPKWEPAAKTRAERERAQALKDYETLSKSYSAEEMRELFPELLEEVERAGSEG